jgi:trimeric autotransporter adhesin
MYRNDIAMSIYPAPKNTSGIFNPASFIGVEDINGTQKLVLDLANYVRSDAGIFQGNLQTSGSLILGNESQNVAFTDSKNTLLINTSNKVEDIAYASNQTTIGGDLQVSGNLLISDNNLTISKISGLQTKLNDIDTNFNNISSNDDDIAALNTFRSAQESYNSTNSTNITNINTVNTDQNDRLDTLETFKTNQLIYNNYNNTLDDAQNTRLDTLEAFQTTQSSYNSSNDTNLSSLASVNTAQNARLTALESYDTANNLTIVNLQNKDSSQDTIISGILSSITNLENADTALQSNITSNDNDISAITTTVSSINTTLVNNASSISDLETLTASHTTSISNLDTFMLAQESYNTSNDTLTASHTTSINSLDSSVSQHSTDISTKQNIINSSNRLNASYIGDGSVSSLAYQTLAGINTSLSIESRLTSLTNTINSLDIDIDTLENLQNIDLTSFSTIGSQITALQTYDSTNDTNLSNMNDLITTSQTDISNLQSNVSSNTGRLNVKDSEISTINTTLTTNTNNISTNTSDIGSLQSGLSSAQADILTKNSIIDVNNKLSSGLVSTSVNSNASTLDVILQSLTDINDTQSTSLTNINSSLTTLSNQISSNDTEILALQNADATHDNLITTVQGDITSLTTTLNTKQDEITVSNKLSSDLVHDVSQGDTLDNIIVRLDGDISTKQNIINGSSAKLPISYVDLSGSNLIYADYASSINTKFTSLDNQISTLTTLQNGDVANFVAIDDNFTALDTQITNITNAIVNVPYLDNVVSDVQGQIDGLISSNLPSLTYDSPSTTTTISNNTKVSTLIFSGDLSQQTTAFTTAHGSELSTATSNISTLQGEMTTAQTDIVTNTTNINLKQDVIDVNNKLPIANVDLSGSSLVNMDYNSSVSTKFTNIDSSLSSQSTLNTSFTNDISTLNSVKQDVLSSGNKLNPQFIQCSGAGELTSTKTQYLSSIDADIATKFTNKADVDNQTFTGTITIPNLLLTGPVSTKSIAENIASSFTSFASNILTYAFTNNSILYFSGLTANTNFKMVLTSVPTNTYQTQTFSLLINVGTYKAFANTCSVNGTDYTLIANGGLANVDVASVSTSGLILQQFTIIYLNSGVFKVITNVSTFY